MMKWIVSESNRKDMFASSRNELSVTSLSDSVFIG